MQNEPNLKNTKMNLNLFNTTNYVIFRPPGNRKNEPNSNPISNFRLEEQFTLIYEIFILIFTNFYTNLPPVYELSTLHSDENGNFHHLGHPKNEPNLRPIRCGYAVMACSSASFYILRPTFASHGPRATSKKMQNEPNFKNNRINITSVLRKDYMENDAFATTKNEPNLRPICFCHAVVACC